MTIQPLSSYDLVLPVESRKGLHATIVKAGTSDPKAGTTFFVASTPDEDRALDVVRQDWRLRSFRQNPVILDNHNTRRVVGKGLKATIPKTGDDAGNLTILVQWDIESRNVDIAYVGDQHINGYRNCGSVGFSIGKATMRNQLPQDHEFYSEGVEVESIWGKYKVVGRYLERNELLEFSSATIPMNPNALQRSFFDELAGIDVEDAVGRAKVAARTVRNRIGSDLVDMVRGMDDEERTGLVDILWPDVLARMARDEAARKAIQAAVALTPRPAPAPPEERTAEATRDWADGSSPVDHLFTVPTAG